MDRQNMERLLSEEHAMESLAEYLLFMQECSEEVKEAVEHQRPMTKELYEQCVFELQKAGAQQVLKCLKEEFRCIVQDK